MTECARCGDCCRVISIHRPVPQRVDGRGDPFTLYERDPGELMQIYHWTVDQIMASYDHDFLREHWHEITVEEAIKRNSFVAQNRQNGPFYTCDQFDEARNLCLAHDEKPEVCWGYPWYGKQPDVFPTSSASPVRILDSLRCSYWADVPKHYWPDGVDPLIPTNCC